MRYLLAVFMLTLLMGTSLERKNDNMAELLDFSAFDDLVVLAKDFRKYQAGSPAATAPVSEDQDRQFYQSTLSGEDRIFEPELGDTYSIKSGDTLSAIAANNPFTLKQLMDVNKGVDPTKLDIGQEINLPTSGETTPEEPTTPVQPVSLEKVEEATTPEAVTEAVAEATPVVAADNPLEYIFNKGFIGLDEKNAKHQSTIAGFINNAVPNFVTKDSQVTQSSKAWCGAFVDHVLENLGAARLDTGDKYDKLRAAQYLGYGEDAGGLDNAQAGDLVVIRNPQGWHVSFYVGKNEKGEVLALGGNQGNSVKVSNYPSASVKGVRRIADVGSMDVDMLKDISSDIAETSGEESTR